MTPNTTSKKRKDRVLSVMSTSKPTLPAPPVRLRKPMASFSIPIIRAELVMDESLINLGTQITYCAPEEVVAFDFDTRRKHTTCRVPVMEGGRLRGYVPLPMRYRDIWLELSYNIVLMMNIWELWSKEEGKALRPKEKKMATACRQNVGTVVVQYMLSRLLAVEELVSLSHNTEPGEERVKILNEWKVRMLRDWFDMTHSEAMSNGPEFMRADPASIENKAFFESDWEIEEDGINILSPPADPNLWIHGRIEGLEDEFERIIKPQALEELQKPSQFFKTRYKKGTKLPERWHEGNEPRPFFWSIKQWNWFCEGNDYWDAPIDLLHYVLITEPAYHEVDQFLGDLRSLSKIISENPNLENIDGAARDLWLGKIIWREFVEILGKCLSLSAKQMVTSEKKDHQNPFNTLEFRLIFEGYVQRDKTNSEGQRADDSILWKSLDQISTQEHRPVLEWVLSGIHLRGDTVKSMLNQAGDWWREFRNKQVKSSQVETHTTEHDNGDGNVACADRSYNNAAQSSNSTNSTRSHVQLHPPITNRVSYPNALDSSTESNSCPLQNSPPPSFRTHESTLGGCQPLALPILSRIHFGLSRYLEGSYSLKTYEEYLVESFSSEFESSIRHYVKELQPFTAEQLATDEGTLISDSFISRVNAIQANIEARESQNQLL
ncbi:hypothetical protein BDR06DRAFT_1014282 [Suillus hirtellus]|nr:hypothetical protein BDR06DRAFT_1014282 [Suillus hirtellus]